MWRSNKILLSASVPHRAFSLVEVVTALAILALTTSSVLVVINRSMVAAADSAKRMQAFWIARDNLEKLLASDSAQETVEYGSSDIYPEIEWQTTVETFYEPLTSRMWIRAVCSAEYPDSTGETQKIELTHWITDLTKKQILEIMEQRRLQQELFAEQIIETTAEAAEYAGVDERTIEQWVENGMKTTPDGDYIMPELDFYKEHDGNPTPEDRQRYEAARETKAGPTGGQGGPGGVSRQALEQMDVPQLYKLINSGQFPRGVE